MHKHTHIHLILALCAIFPSTVLAGAAHEHPNDLSGDGAPLQVRSISLNASIVDLGLGVALAINARGEIVGVGDYPYHATLWRDGVVTDLGTLPGGIVSQAWDINDRGQVVGNSVLAYDLTHAFLWQEGVMTDLGTLPGLDSCFATAINNHCQIVGYCSNDNVGPSRAFIWHDGIITDLGTLPGSSETAALDINDMGQVVGQSGSLAIGSHPVLWQDGTITDLAPDRGGAAYAINNLGQIAGESNSHAVLWQAGVMTDLGTLGGTYSAATSINDRGQVVGLSDYSDDSFFHHAFIWQEGSMTDLGTLLSSPRERHSQASGINNRGQIVGGSNPGAEDHAVLWEVRPGHPVLKGQLFRLNSAVTGGRPLHIINRDGEGSGIR